VLTPDPIAEADPQTRTDYVCRGEALRILQVKPQTLYSYVSRGLVRRLPHPDQRTSYYSRQDIARLKARSLARSGHGPAAASAMHWGEPVLTTAITENTEQGPRYREHLAVNLVAGNCSFETVADYLWTGEMAHDPVTWRARPELDVLGSRLSETAHLHARLHIRHLLTQVVQLLATVPVFSDAISDQTSSAGTLIRAMAGAFGFLGPRSSYLKLKDDESIAHGLARALGVQPHPRHLHALNAALVLVADHEFTSPTFVARIAASSGSDLPSCVVAALEVHFGSVLGLDCDRLEQLLDVVSRDRPGPGRLGPLMEAARTGPGFDHPLYLHGDPRAKALFELMLRDEGPSGLVNATLQSLEELCPNAQEHPNLCEALVVLCRSLGMPHQAAGGLLALGRSAGWIAHIVEQRQQGFLIRPRGKFVARDGPIAAE